MSAAARVIVLGASAGGVTALQRFLRLLKPNFSIPLVVVQHMPSGTQVNMDLVYGSATSLVVSQAEPNMQVRPGHCYFAQPGYHLLFETSGEFSLSQDEPVNFSRPSIDVTFESAALAFGPGAVGVLLTGANRDGAQGLQQIHLHGGLTLVQDPTEAEVATMPQAALDIFKPDHVLTLAGIAKVLSSLDGGAGY